MYRSLVTLFQKEMQNKIIVVVIVVFRLTKQNTVYVQLTSTIIPIPEDLGFGN